MSDNRKRVVITGMGAITPLGHSVQALWTGIKEGRSGIARITQIDPTDYPSQVAGEVKDFNPNDFMDKKEARNMARYCDQPLPGQWKLWPMPGLVPRGRAATTRNG